MVVTFNTRNINFDNAFQGNFADAIRDYSVAIAKDSSHFKAYFNRGFSYDKVKKVVEPHKDMTRISTHLSTSIY